MVISLCGEVTSLCAVVLSLRDVVDSLCGVVPLFCGFTICVVVSAVYNVVSLFRKSSLLRVSSVITQDPFSLRTRLSSFCSLRGPVPTLGIQRWRGVSEGEGNANLSSVLEKLHLGQLLQNFQREKVTVYEICK